MTNETGPLGKAIFEFTEHNSACVIRNPETPRYWYNYLWNE